MVPPEWLRHFSTTCGAMPSRAAVVAKVRRRSCGVHLSAVFMALESAAFGLLKPAMGLLPSSVVKMYGPDHLGRPRRMATTGLLNGTSCSRPDLLSEAGSVHSARSRSTS